MTAERRPAPRTGKNSKNTSSGTSNSVAREYVKDGELRSRARIEENPSAQ
jgi:hypothetical protein